MSICSNESFVAPTNTVFDALLEAAVFFLVEIVLSVGVAYSVSSDFKSSSGARDAPKLEEGPAISVAFAIGARAGTGSVQSKRL